jgi:hypothetical protein
MRKRRGSRHLLSTVALLVACAEERPYTLWEKTFPGVRTARVVLDSDGGFGLVGKTADTGDVQTRRRTYPWLTKLSDDGDVELQLADESAGAFLTASVADEVVVAQRWDPDPSWDNPVFRVRRFDRVGQLLDQHDLDLDTHQVHRYPVRSVTSDGLVIAAIDDTIVATGASNGERRWRIVLGEDDFVSSVTELVDGNLALSGGSYTGEGGVIANRSYDAVVWYVEPSGKVIRELRFPADDGWQIRTPSVSAMGLVIETWRTEDRRGSHVPRTIARRITHYDHSGTMVWRTPDEREATDQPMDVAVGPNGYALVSFSRGCGDSQTWWVELLRDGQTQWSLDFDDVIPDATGLPSWGSSVGARISSVTYTESGRGIIVGTQDDTLTWVRVIDVGN